jgi:hypothetical protein
MNNGPEEYWLPREDVGTEAMWEAYTVNASWCQVFGTKEGRLNFWKMLLSLSPVDTFPFFSLINFQKFSDSRSFPEV